MSRVQLVVNKEQPPYLKWKENHFLILGRKLKNSSVENEKDIKTIFPKLQRIGLDTTLIPTY